MKYLPQRSLKVILLYEIIENKGRIKHSGERKDCLICDAGRIYQLFGRKELHPNHEQKISNSSIKALNGKKNSALLTPGSLYKEILNSHKVVSTFLGNSCYHLKI